MLYALTKELALSAMKAPTRPPEAPAGGHGEVRVFRASPNFLTYRLLIFWFIISLNWLVPWIIFLAWINKQQIALLILSAIYAAVLLTIQLCVYFAIRIDYDMRYYIVTDRSLRIREGAVIVKEKTITFANVQNIRVVQGPIMRLFRFWNLNVDTAGGGASRDEHTERVPHRVKMAGIENAQEVRDLIRGHLRQYARSTGLGDLDDHDEAAAAHIASSTAYIDALRALHTATTDLRTAVIDRRSRG